MRCLLIFIIILLPTITFSHNLNNICFEIANYYFEKEVKLIKNVINNKNNIDGLIILIIFFLNMKLKYIQVLIWNLIFDMYI